MKVVNCTKCNEEYAIDLNKPEEWYCPYCDNLYSITTDKLSVEKLQEQLNTAKKYIEHVIGTIKHDGHLGTIQTDWILPYLEKTLAAIGGDDE
ncbi:hypothetical protein ACN9S9_05820 [Lactococcus lactis]